MVWNSPKPLDLRQRNKRFGMNRPLLLRISPPELRAALYYRWYRSRRAKWRALFDDAPLDLAPNFKMKLSETDEAHGEIAFTGFYELALSRRFVTEARAGGLLVDVGANYGYFSLLWLGRRPGNQVIAFEASPRNHAPLRANIARNNCESRVQLHELALGTAAGTAQFSLGDEGQTGWGGIVKGGGAAEVTVQVNTLDQMIGPSVTVDLLKIDVEGADSWVLQGARRLLTEKRVRNIYFEQNRPRMSALGIGEDEAMKFLQSVGYKASVLSGEGTEVVEYQAQPA